MRVTYYSHASFRLVTDQGVRLLCDPWTYNPIHNLMWQFPECPIGPADYVDQDYIYISHSHVDHFCPLTLGHIPRHIPIIIRAYGDLDNPIRPTLVEMGFETIIELQHGETRRIERDLTVTLYADLGTVDSAIVASDGRHSVFHQNDCMMPIEEARKIGAAHKVDLALLGVINSSIYPTFFVMDETRKKAETEARKQRVLDRSSAYGEAVGARFVVPCACDMIYIRVPDSDAYLGPHTFDFRRDAAAKSRPFTVLTMAPGDELDLAEPRLDFTPAYSSQEELMTVLAAMRRRPDVQAAIAAQSLWEDGFVHDPAVYEAAMIGYAAHVTANFADMFKHNLDKVQPRTWRTLFAVTDGEASVGYEIALDFAAGTMRFTRAPHTLDPAGRDMVMAFDAKCLAMQMAGVMDISDIRSGWALIYRPGAFTPEEVAFWHVMTLFNAYLKTRGAFSREHAFPGRVSTVFKPDAALVNAA
ncbi:MBL fold metallo-hydrolase [Caulobacter segnis]|uniref:MBL fold metallo-hydrolase n=1 Tax=Caulobacter segnis TaxID=88688 RepID=UPI0024105C16|nr:MBL fold metallo-hydrolase [Caulobacter segnis]MDG2521184.1 MBL fold metallo-hydrolase [Caulobacter segnis]